MPIFNLHNGELTLRIYVQPKSSQDKIVGRHGDELKITITAAPTDGKANRHIQSFLAKYFNVPKSKVVISKGQLSRHKTVKISDIQTLPKAILELNEGC